MPWLPVEPKPTKYMDFLDDPSGDTPAVVTRIPRLIAQRGTTFGDFLNAFSRFLLDPIRVRVGLKRINDRMWLKAQDNAMLAPGVVLTEDGLAAALALRDHQRAGLAPIAKHLLSAVLTDIENENGFDVPAPRRRAVTLTDLVNNESFRQDLIGEGRTWKDPGVKATHGEFTHRLQWCAAMLEMPAGNDWQAHFVSCGTWADDTQFAGNRFGLWDALVDRNAGGTPGGPTPYDSRDVNDFRSPENLQAWLLDPLQRDAFSDIRFLAMFIEARNAKREAEQAANVPYVSPDPPLPPGAVVPRVGVFRTSSWDKWSRLLFQDQFAMALSRADRRTLARAWYRLTLLQDGFVRYPIVVPSPMDDLKPVGPDLSAAYLSLGLDANGN